MAPSTDKPPRADRSRVIRRALAPTAVLVLLLAEPARASIFGPETPHSPNAEDISTTYWVMLAVAVLAVLVLHVALIRAVVRNRAERDRRPLREAAGRGAIGRSAVALGVFALAVFVFGVVMSVQTRSVEQSGPDGLSAASSRFVQVGLRDVPPIEAAEEGAETPQGGPLRIEAIGQQWLWRFEYPGNDPQDVSVFSYGELVVPVDTAVVLSVTSTDVMHTWWIPSLGGQVQAVPGDVSETWFKADEEGVYRGASTTFSGTGYPAMRAWVRVVSAEDYTAYTDGLEADLSEAQEEVQRQIEQGAPGSSEAAP